MSAQSFFHHVCLCSVHHARPTNLCMCTHYFFHHIYIYLCSVHHTRPTYLCTCTHSFFYHVCLCSVHHARPTYLCMCTHCFFLSSSSYVPLVRVHNPSGEDESSVQLLEPCLHFFRLRGKGRFGSSESLFKVSLAHNRCCHGLCQSC